MLKFRLPNIRLDKEPSLREKILFSAAMVGILLFTSNSFWAPHSGAIKQMQVELKGITAQADAVRKLIDATQKQIARQEDEPQVQPMVDSHLKAMTERRVTDVAGEINSTADLLGSRHLAGRLKITKVAIGDRMEREAYSIVPITVELSGPYTSVQMYMEAIGGLDRPLVVRSFSMEARKDVPGDLNTKLAVDLYIVKR